jgi:hypothetical protein
MIFEEDIIYISLINIINIRKDYNTITMFFYPHIQYVNSNEFINFIKLLQNNNKIPKKILMKYLIKTIKNLVNECKTNYELKKIMDLFVKKII